MPTKVWSISTGRWAGRGPISLCHCALSRLKAGDGVALGFRAVAVLCSRLLGSEVCVCVGVRLEGRAEAQAEDVESRRALVMACMAFRGARAGSIMASSHASNDMARSTRLCSK